MSNPTTPSTVSTRCRPVDPSDLVAAVRDLLRPAETAPGASSSVLAEDTLHVVGVLLRAARTANPVDGAALRELAERLATHTPHVLGEIEALEHEQAAGEH